MHDNETGNSLFAEVKDLDFEYQAEEWIKETMDNFSIIRWELKDKKEGTTIIKWERPEGSVGYPKKTRLVA